MIEVFTSTPAGGEPSPACNLELVVGVELALLDATSRNGSAASNRKHILDGHQKGHIELAFGSRESVSTVFMGSMIAFCRARRSILDGAERRTANDGGIVAVKVVRVEELLISARPSEAPRRRLHRTCSERRRC